MAAKDDDLFMADLESDFLSDDSDNQAGSNDSDDAQQSDDWLNESEVPGQLTVDVYQTKEDIIVVAPVPGVDKNSIDLSIVESTLTIRGSRKGNKEVKTSDYIVQECYWGEFSRSIILPMQVKEDEADAELKDGMLRVRIPKAEQDKIKKISIS